MTAARPPHSWILNRFELAASIVGQRPASKLSEQVQRAFTEQLVVVLPSYVQGAYGERYEEFWQRMESGKSLTYGEAVEWSKLIIVLRDLFELESYLAPKEQASEAERKRSRPRNTWRRSGGQNPPTA